MGKRIPRLSEKQVIDRMAHARRELQGAKWKGWLSREEMGHWDSGRPPPPMFVEHGEQASLSPDLTVELARALGVRHPQYGRDSRTGGPVPDMLVVTKDAAYVCNVKWQKAGDAAEKDGGSHG
jgi:hypothetical protein